jgi:hypothetical protein
MRSSPIVERDKNGNVSLVNGRAWSSAAGVARDRREQERNPVGRVAPI